MEEWTGIVITRDWEGQKNMGTEGSSISERKKK
jgi:hypothetical protein